jgi:hypothetical protein
MPPFPLPVEDPVVAAPEFPVVEPEVALPLPEPVVEPELAPDVFDPPVVAPFVPLPPVYEPVVGEPQCAPTRAKAPAMGNATGNATDVSNDVRLMKPLAFGEDIERKKEHYSAHNQRAVSGRVPTPPITPASETAGKLKTETRIARGRRS